MLVIQEHIFNSKRIFEIVDDIGSIIHCVLFALGLSNKTHLNFFIINQLQ